MSETDRLSLPVMKLARENDAFRKVVWTGDKTQLVLMAIPEGGEIGGEVHDGHDQLLYFVEGTGKAMIGGVECEVADGDVGIVPSGAYHNFRNTGVGMLKLFTTYSPPEHEPGTEHSTRREADMDSQSDGF
ncbi:MAG: cupin domain-containing protein [Rhodobacteraceae bacterium]|nr:cupin domain-containing protein [Paracoccaceae bacterium]